MVHQNKRSAAGHLGPSKKRKFHKSGGKTERDAAKKAKSKEKAADKAFVPIPSLEDNVELSDQDYQVLDEFGGAASFLNHIDHKGLMRSKTETERLRQLNKPIRKLYKTDDLPPVDSHSEDEGSWSSGIDDDPIDGASDVNSIPSSSSLSRSTRKVDTDEPDVEMVYEKAARKRRPSWDVTEKREIQRLPIKLADGRIQDNGKRKIMDEDSSEEDTNDEGEEPQMVPPPLVEDVSTGARFGRPAIVDILGHQSRKTRIEGAKVQIASICQEILADPEYSLGLLRRLHTFSLENISTPSHPDPVPNELIIQKLAILSQLKVFKDIIPGYRIRTLTEKEKTEKVSQMVTHTREWEQGLVIVYQSYLRNLEKELKEPRGLEDIALYCMCILLKEVTHFNFRVNLMTCIVARLSKKSWSKASDLCLEALITVFREDSTGTPSLEIVRLLNRMIKERRFTIHPKVLSCLLYLRLRTELGVRASDSKVDDKENERGKKGKRRKEKAPERVHLSKKAKKERKERKEIEKELKEAEAVVDKEERASTQTETLKLLFALYFRILKNPTPTPLLPAALSGIVKFAHLVNIDFFKDLMKTLKSLIILLSGEEERKAPEAAVPVDSTSENYLQGVTLRLLCIFTAFDLLTGQGEALNIDLTEFIRELYAMIQPITLMHDIDTALSSSMFSGVEGGEAKSFTPSDMLFRSLRAIFQSHASNMAPSWRAAAFAKRLLSAALHWQPGAAIQAVDLVRGLVARDVKLQALLSTEDRIFDGIYRPEVDDPQLSHPFGTSFFELHALTKHWHPHVREKADELMNWKEG